ncbi:MAG TPA: hypothetical protein ENK71_00155 [Epsilonproteobacteria bacterium]|nr:hypothetical protein [Campylobacterota bacterium]
MKKLLFLAGLASAAVILSGCGGGGGGGYVPPPPPPAPSILYLDGDMGPAVGVPYLCDSGTGVTDPDGGFLFYPGDSCSFDLTGYDGTIFFTDNLYIDYADNTGVSGISYDCFSGLTGVTDLNGYFDYDVDDECTFYL